MSVTHIAGPVITIGCRRIQRCAVCGEKLCDNLPYLQGKIWSPTPYASEGPCPSSQDTMSTWEPGGLVQYDGDCQIALPHINGDELPEDYCLELVEE